MNLNLKNTIISTRMAIAPQPLLSSTEAIGEGEMMKLRRIGGGGGGGGKRRRKKK